MATQTDFDNLIVRIDDATDTLEATITSLGGGVAQVNAQVVEATTQAEVAGIQSGIAIDAAVAATQARDELLEAVGYGDAPSNGNTYGRNDGQWVVVEAGSGGGGTVNSVNGVSPDSLGDVSLRYSSLKGKPTVLPEAPEDGKQYARKDGGWVVVGYAEAPEDGKQYSRKDGAWVVAGYAEAPEDGKQYARKDGAWVRIGGVEAPEDGKKYARKDGAWVRIGFDTEAPLDGKQYARKDGAWVVIGDSGGGWTNLNPLGVTYSPTAIDWFKSNSKVAGTVEFDTELEATTALGAYTTNASTPATLSPYEAIDVRCFDYKVGGNTVFGGALEQEFEPSTGDFVQRLDTVITTLVHPTYNTDLIASIPAGCYAVQWINSDLSFLIGADTLSTEFGIEDTNIGRDFFIKVSEVGTEREVIITFFGSPRVGNEPTKSVYRWNKWAELWQPL